jgi:hypothetical protein
MNPDDLRGMSDDELKKLFSTTLEGFAQNVGRANDVLQELRERRDAGDVEAAEGIAESYVTQKAWRGLTGLVSGLDQIQAELSSKPPGQEAADNDRTAAPEPTERQRAMFAEHFAGNALPTDLDDNRPLTIEDLVWQFAQPGEQYSDRAIASSWSLPVEFVTAIRQAGVDGK